MCSGGQGFDSDISLSHARVMLNNSCFTLLSNFRSVVCQGRLQKAKNIRKFPTFISVAYERWSVTRGSQHSDLTWKLLVFLTTGCCMRKVSCNRTD